MSDAYQAYAAEMGYTAYLDFFWMKNAFLIDYLADTIRGEGYQLGIISSKDGFVRCLDETGEKEYRYYQYQDGTMRTPYLSAADGKDHTAASELIVYSGEYGCANTLLAAFSDYQAESLSRESLETLTSQNIYSIWFEDDEMQTTDEDLAVIVGNE